MAFRIPRSLSRTIPQQSKPRLSKGFGSKMPPSTTRSRPSILWVFLLFAAVLLIHYQFWRKADYEFIATPQHVRKANINRNITRRRSQKHQPPFPPYPTPGYIQKPSQFDWDAWAARPLEGSYQFSTAATYHGPYCDLHEKMAKRNTNEWLLQDQAFAHNESVVLTLKGEKFSASGVRANQDRVGILWWKTDWWMGLFDGHGEFGHVASAFAVYEFARRMDQLYPTSSKPIESSIAETFQAVDQALPDLPGAGTTAISIWKRQDQLYISNLGDSKAFVVSVDMALSPPGVKIIYETKPHKPDDPQERKRIEQMGGEVADPPFPGLSARLLIPIGDPPIDMLGLAMSRSLGDHEGVPFGVIAKPTTDVLNLKEVMSDPKLQYLVVVASDGLLDKVSDVQVAQTMAEAMLKAPKGTTTHPTLLPLEAAEKLILQSSDIWLQDPMEPSYRDDISLAVHRLRID